VSKSGISHDMTLFRIGLFLLTILTSLLVQANRIPLPFFVPVLVHQSSPLQVRTLSSFEMTTSLRLTPDPADLPDLESQMFRQFLKLHRLMPVRAEKIWRQWKFLFKNLSEIQMDISLPPGIDWNEWAKPHNEDLKPVAVVNFSIDGRRLFYVDRVLFPALTTAEQAQVVWQLLWTTELGTDDNLKIRTMTNYLFSKEWLELEPPTALPLFQKFGFEYFEAQGFCFQIDDQLKLYPSGRVQSATAYENCLVTYDDREVKLLGPLDLSEEGRLLSRFRVSEETPWTEFWEGHYFRFTFVEQYPDRGLKSGIVMDSTPAQCANTPGSIHIQTSYAELIFDCLQEMQFHPNGVLLRISNAEAIVPIRGQTVRVGLSSSQIQYGPSAISFFENGAIRSGIFQAGTTLESLDGQMTELKQSRYLRLNEDGFVVF